jgi:hypothetical protein
MIPKSLPSDLIRGWEPVLGIMLDQKGWVSFNIVEAGLASRANGHLSRGGNLGAFCGCGVILISR